MIRWKRETFAREPALLLDRDGVINQPIPDGFVLDYDRDFRLMPAFPASVRGFVERGFPLIVLSNQSCVGRGLISRPAVIRIMNAIVGELDRRGIQLAGYLICPHAPQAKCECRKPAPGLLLECERSFGVDLAACAFIGDSQSDLQAGARAGCPTFLADPQNDARYRRAFAEAFESLTRRSGGASRSR